MLIIDKTQEMKNNLAKRFKVSKVSFVKMKELTKVPYYTLDVLKQGDRWSVISLSEDELLISEASFANKHEAKFGILFIERARD